MVEFIGLCVPNVWLKIGVKLVLYYFTVQWYKNRPALFEWFNHHDNEVRLHDQKTQRLLTPTLYHTSTHHGMMRLCPFSDTPYPLRYHGTRCIGAQSHSFSLVCYILGSKLFNDKSISGFSTRAQKQHSCIHFPPLFSVCLCQGFSIHQWEET